MKKEDIKKVRSLVQKYGDGFWSEKDNDYLFEDIVSAVNKAGYDLILVKKGDNSFESRKLKVGHNMYTSTIKLKTPIIK